MNTKAFPTLAVAGVYTGRLLAPGGFGDIHEVMDHLFPGIMTIGVAAMADVASAEVARQLPQLATLGKPGDNDWQQYADRVVRELGPELSMHGPMAISDAAIGAAFDRFATPLRRGEKAPKP